MWFNSRLKAENEALKQKLIDQQDRYEVEIEELKKYGPRK